MTLPTDHHVERVREKADAVEARTHSRNDRGRGSRARPTGARVLASGNRLAFSGRLSNRDVRLPLRLPAV